MSNDNTMSIENKVVEREFEGKTVYCPAYFINGEEHLTCEQGVVVFFDTEEEALEYFIDEEE